MLCSNTFFLAADEKLTPTHAGGSFTARGWSRFSEILGKNYYFIISLSLQFCFQYIVVYFILPKY